MATLADESNNDRATIAKLTAQLKKLNEANGKYKNLLKMAKERIQQQEMELKSETLTAVTSDNTTNNNTNNNSNDETRVVRVHQCVKQKLSIDKTEIWAFMDFETMNNDSDEIVATERKWQSFTSMDELKDFCRRDSGEPIRIPELSLTPEQSKVVQEEAKTEITLLKEDFRRFRVQAELSRQKMQTQLESVQSTSKSAATQRIQQTADTSQFQAQLAAQEAHWQEAYQKLLEENQALQSTGSEALLAGQWRQRYEQVKKENEVLQQKVSKKEQHQSDDYELKYRDLKESFRLYRKKAKEILDSQSGGVMAMDPSSDSSADAKLSYLRNLMANYLSADAEVRDHMEGAIGTVLQFTTDQQARIDQKRAENEAWFYSY